MAVHNQTHNQVLRPGNLSELFSLWNRFPQAVPYAGGTELMRSGSDPGGARGIFREQPELPEIILSLEKIEELRGITRTERYLEIGAMVRLGEIIALGKIVPHAFSRTIQGIAGPMVQNIATIGGNICSEGDTMTPLCALDAVFELRNTGGSRWISALRYASLPENLQKGELLTRIRIPLEAWNYTVYRKFSDSGSGEERGVLILVVQNQKNLLSNINVIFSGPASKEQRLPAGEAHILQADSPAFSAKKQSVLLRDKDSEAFLKGKSLPLDRRDAGHYRKFWEAYLDSLKYPGPLLREKILNAIEMGIVSLSD